MPHPGITANRRVLSWTCRIKLSDFLLSSRTCRYRSTDGSGLSVRHSSASDTTSPLSARRARETRRTRLSKRCGSISTGPYSPGGSKLSFVAEYAYSFIATAWHVKARRRGRFAVMQACNPPDIFWPIALVLRAVDRTKFVFDHHDLCPELFQSRFPGDDSLPYRGLLALERATHRTADHVISTNDSYRDIAIRRSGKRPQDVTVVRTGPDPAKLKRGQAEPGLKRGRSFLAAYIGVMGPQDGVDIVIRAAGIVVHEMGREDIAFTLIGKGDCFDELIALRDELQLNGHVEFTGRAPDDLVIKVMSTAEIGLSPDPKNPLNDLSTMNKTMEYMAFKLPVVAFDLRETRVSAGDAAVYVSPTGSWAQDVRDYAKAIVNLADDADNRERMGKLGRVRVEEELAWSYSAHAYLGVYARVARPAKSGKA